MNFKTALFAIGLLQLGIPALAAGPIRCSSGLESPSVEIQLQLNSSDVPVYSRCYWTQVAAMPGRIATSGGRICTETTNPINAGVLGGAEKTGKYVSQVTSLNFQNGNEEALYQVTDFGVGFLTHTYLIWNQSGRIGSLKLSNKAQPDASGQKSQLGVLQLEKDHSKARVYCK